jgi:hypothetical protein
MHKAMQRRGASWLCHIGGCSIQVHMGLPVHVNDLISVVDTSENTYPTPIKH